MGTRNLTAVYANGEYKIAQYGQWDGYPEGQGLTALNFLRSLTENNWHQFLQNVDACHWLSDEELDEIGKGDWQETHPWLSRDRGAEILSMVYAQPLGLSNAIDFAKDSLFCEWAYVVDLDKNTFEVYVGFQESPIDEDERFYTTELNTENHKQYYPIRHLKTYDLDHLPSNDEFTAELNQLCEEIQESA